MELQYITLLSLPATPHQNTPPHSRHGNTNHSNHFLCLYFAVSPVHVIQDIVVQFETQYSLCVEYSNRKYSDMIYLPFLYTELNFALEKLRFLNFIFCSSVTSQIFFFFQVLFESKF